MAGQDGVPGGTPRGGARRGPKAKRSLRPGLVGLGAGAFLALVVWGLLVWMAIGSGRDARGGESGQWLWLVLASVGAVVFLFLALWLITLLLRGVGILSRPPPKEPPAPRSPHRH